MNAQEQTQKQGESEKPKKKIPRKRKLMFLGVAAGMVAVAAVAFNVWHATPGFCNNPVCHSIMDPYVQTYSQAEGQAGTDKWGNEVTNTASMMAVTHASQSISCLDCHVSDLGQQIGEAQETVSSAYTTPLFEVGAKDMLSHANHESPSGIGDELCMNGTCHSDLTRNSLTQATANLSFNPHDWHHGLGECTDCHKSHRASVMVCTECHLEAADVMPDGWVNAREGRLAQPVVAS